jgi:hypothetical protein
MKKLLFLAIVVNRKDITLEPAEHILHKMWPTGRVLSLLTTALTALEPIIRL